VPEGEKGRKKRKHAVPFSPSALKGKEKGEKGGRGCGSIVLFLSPVAGREDYLGLPLFLFLLSGSRGKGEGKERNYA